ncbi:MAG TPA: Crp/Fnr family transcriptional regulator [Chitinophagaceae bacterium]|nr:Crp/Fnr family transcriptional regulator [Chitinophagaceae bacterium]
MYDKIRAYISRYISLTEEETALFTALLKPKSLRKRQYLLQAGDVSRFECFVNTGCLRAYSLDDNGQEHVVQFAVEDWWIGDMYSFLTQTPATYNIEALEDSEVVLLDKAGYDRLLDSITKFDRMFRIIIQNAFIAQQRRVIENMSLPAQERYLLFQKRYPQLGQRLPQHQVASYLGITPESLSRVRRLAADNYISKKLASSPISPFPTTSATQVEYYR